MEILIIVLAIIALLVIAGRRKPAEPVRIINDQDEQKRQEQETDELITVILPTIDNDK